MDEDAGTQPERAPSATVVRPRVMFVDDDVNLLAGLRRGLRHRRDDWDFSFHSDPLAALEAVRLHEPDVLVADLSMPGMGGLDLIAQVQESAPGTVCLMLTGTADLDDAVTAINVARVFRFYTKPCPPEELEAGIEAALAQRQAKVAPSSSSQTAAVLDRLDLPVLVTDGNGVVRYTNRSGGRLLADKRGLSLAPDGRLRATDRESTKAMWQAIGMVGTDGIGEITQYIRVERHNYERPLVLVIAPVTAGESAALILVNDPEGDRLASAETIATLLELSPTEAKLARALANGLTLEDAAESLSVTLNTARTYLKQVFLKTSTNRQPDLVRLVLTLTAHRSP